MGPGRFDLVVIDLGGTPRPCVIVSPDEMNDFIRTIMVAPLASQGHEYPTRVPCRIEGEDRHVVLDQIRTVEKGGILERLGRLEEGEQAAVLKGLATLFAR